MNAAIILSGGVGSRLGTQIPKQYIEVGGRPIIDYCVSTFLNVSNIDIIIIVAAKQWQEFINNLVIKHASQKTIVLAEAGQTRQLSIFNGLRKIDEIKPDGVDIVIIHDAARPMVSKELITKCLKTCESADGVLPVIPVKDTIYQSFDGKTISKLLDRSTLYAGQAPEAFKFKKYLSTHRLATKESLMATNGSSEIAFNSGMKISIIEGDIRNFKITDTEDLEKFKLMVI